MRDETVPEYNLRIDGTPIPEPIRSQVSTPGCLRQRAAIREELAFEAARRGLLWEALRNYWLADLMRKDAEKGEMT